MFFLKNNLLFSVQWTFLMVFFKPIFPKSTFGAVFIWQSDK